MIESLKRLFRTKEHDPSRRKFIRPGAELAALTVVVSTGVHKLVPEERVLAFEQMIKSGIVEGQHFYVDRTLVIDIPNVIVRNCMFEAVAPIDTILELRSSGAVIEACHFHTKGIDNVTAISIPDAQNFNPENLNNINFKV